ncbi:MAG: endonuclease/exonuclease/phosphatase family protein [Caldilineaceae bacterium]
MVGFITGIGVLLITATVLPLLRKDAWWIRFFDFPRLQLIVLLMLTFVVAWFVVGTTGFVPNLLLAGLVVSLLYQCYMMFPYTRWAHRQVQQSRQPPSTNSISLVSVNVLMSNRNSATLKKILHTVDPDIILTLEADEWWQDQMKEFEQTHLFTVYQPQDNCYGMLLYSRLELVNPQIKFRVQDDIPSIYTRVCLPSGEEIELYCLHPRPPLPEATARSTERDVELLLVGKEVKGKALPVIVIGDLNDVGWSHTSYLFRDISGLLDPRVGRGFYNTFHAKYPFIRFPLDHVFHSNDFRLLDLRRLPYFGSDHFPIFIRLSYEPSAEQQQPELEASPAEEAEAAEEIQKL